MRVRGVKPKVLADQLGVSVWTINRRIKEHKIQVIPLGPRTRLIPYPEFERIMRHGIAIEN